MSRRWVFFTNACSKLNNGFDEYYFWLIVVDFALLIGNILSYTQRLVEKHCWEEKLILSNYKKSYTVYFTPSALFFNIDSAPHRGFTAGL